MVLLVLFLILILLRKRGTKINFDIELEFVRGGW